VGTVNVSSNIAGASFNISGPASISGSGMSNSYPNRPTGTYTIVWNAVAGYTTPASTSSSLTAGSSISLTGNYVAVPAPTVTLSPFTPDTITVGGSATISFSSTNATSCSGDAGSFFPGPFPVTSFSNASTGVMSTPGTFTQRITCTGPGGNGTSVLRTLRVNPPAPTTEIQATPGQISL
jgi:hypothetical protein